MRPNFFELVYEVAVQVPEGRVTTYSAIAKYLGNPRGSRAVGWAMRQCPYPLSKVPCHRVIKSDGTVGGFGGEGTERKIVLLRKEGIHVRKGQVNLDRYFFDQFKLKG
ncbi:MAG: MGMT family protein [Nitrososphaerales archaeon]